MYVTTFPCHMCARHIIAVGLNRVVYVEPYPKSKVKQLYGDAVSVDGEHGRKGAVKFEPYVGMAPRQYLEFFTMPDEPEREDSEGYVKPWNKETRSPRVKRYVASYLLIELRVEKYIAEKYIEHKEEIQKSSQEFSDELNLRMSFSPCQGEKRLGDWLEDRKKEIDIEMGDRFPEWIRIAISPHEYN